jgi:alcohol dehydrogenase (cytochrome c)
MRKLAITTLATSIGLAFAAGAPANQDLQRMSKDDAQWIMPAKDYANTRFSKLDQINADNVGQLQMAWVFSTGVLNGHESAPLVVGDTLYLVTPFPNALYAIDLKEPGGALKWTYQPQPARAAQGVACCDVVNRGAAYVDGKIVFNTLDNHTVAVDAKSGKEVWRTKLGDINQGESMTMAPLVVKDKVLVGNSGGEMGVRGWITALDADDGQVAWRAYSTGPDKDVLIGKDFKAPYAQGSDLGAKTWPSEKAWRIGGGTVWGWLSYDPESDLIYYGTSNPGPWNPDQRPGDNKWTAAVFARDADTGMAKWAYQFNPHDLYDYDGVNENVLLDLDIDGQKRKVLVHVDRNGFVYVMDRMTGKIVSAEPFVPVNVIERIDLQTGKPVHVKAKHPTEGKMVEDICPSASGGKDWQPTAWSPQTQLLYIPHSNLCMDFKAGRANYIAGTPYVGATVAFRAGPGGHRGNFTAWDPAKNEKVWQIEEEFPVWSGALATAGDVVFYGTLDRWFKAVHAKTGEELWKIRLGSGVMGQPITFRGPDNRQYVAVLGGVGGWAGAVVAGGLDPRVPYGALGFVGATQDLPQHTNEGGALYVFALPESVTQSASKDEPARASSTSDGQ